MNAARVSSPRATRARRASQVPVSSGEARLFSGQRVDEPDAHRPSARGSSRRAPRRSAGSASRSSRRAWPACPGPSRAWRRAAPRRRCRVRPTPSRPAASPPCGAAAGASAWSRPRACRPGAAPPRAAAASGARRPRLALVRAAGRLAELRDRLPAGDEPHPTARAVAIGRRRQRRHERLVARRSAASSPRGSARRRAAPASGGTDADHDVGERELRVGVERARGTAAPPDRRCAARRAAARRGARACPWGRWRGGRSPCRRRTRGASARAASRAAARRTARSRAARPAPRTAWAAPSPMSLVRWRESVRG